jgi:hypothetical protein
VSSPFSVEVHPANNRHVDMVIGRKNAITAWMRENSHDPFVLMNAASDHLGRYPLPTSPVLVQADLRGY